MASETPSPRAKIYASGITELNPGPWGPCVSCGSPLIGEDSCGKSPCCSNKGEAGTVWCPTCRAWRHYRGAKWMIDPVKVEAVYRVD